MKKFVLILTPALFLGACANLHDVNHNWCDPTENQPLITQTPPAVVQIPDAPVKQADEKIEIKADALFLFDRGDEEGLVAGAKQELDKIAGIIQNDFSKVEKIILIGHTDKLGSYSYNMALSQKRAQTVADYLKRKLKIRGIDSDMQVIGKGSSLSRTSCDNISSKKALRECLQPDRRVEIEILGLKLFKAN